MFRLRLFFTSTAGLLAIGLFTLSGRGQAQSSSPRTLISRTAPPAIERGINPDATHGPGTPETRRRASLRSMSAVVDRAGRSGARYRTGRVIVKFKDGMSAATRVSALSSVSRTATMAARSSWQNFDVVQIDATADAEAAADVLRARSDVDYAQAAYRVHAEQASTCPTGELCPNDQFYPQQWNLPLIDMQRAWGIQPAAGSAITVAVLDTGIAYTPVTMQFTAAAFCLDALDNVNPTPCISGETQYPALGALTLRFVAATELGPSSRFVAPHDFIWADNQAAVDMDGHGTHVSGTIGQLTNNRNNGLGDAANGGGTAGVAFNVRLMPVKVLDTEWDNIFGAPNSATDDIVAQGIRYAADNGAKIINMSLGRTGPADCGTKPNQSGCAPVVEDAIRYAVGKGVFVAIAGGNDFTDGNPIEVIAEIASRVQGAVSVAAVNMAKGRAAYSSTGTWVELAAPGGEFGGFGTAGGVLQQTLDFDLVDTFDLPPSRFVKPRFDALAYFFITGTSMATPHVAGVAAMLMQQGITSPAAIEAALERFATPCSESRNTCDASVAPNRNASFGFGLLEARSALRGLGLAK